MQKTKVRWGFGGPLYWEFQNFDPNPVYSKLKFIERIGFTVCGTGLGELDKLTPAELDKLYGYMMERNQRYCPHVGFDFINTPPAEAEKKVKDIADSLRRNKRFYEGTITKTGLHAGHRFDRTMPLDQKFARLSAAIKPLAQACWDLDLPLCVENHGDYYVSDIVDLCKATPHLYLFLDTGNTYLIAEKPLPAFEAGAPWTIGTHFKDHMVNPVYSPLGFNIQGAVLGEGDVGLRQCWELLRKHAPLDRLIMETELIVPKGMNPLEAMDKSVAFIKTLEGAWQ